MGSPRKSLLKKTKRRLVAPAFFYNRGELRAANAVQPRRSSPIIASARLPQSLH
jgi:hypothetical protein